MRERPTTITVLEAIRRMHGGGCEVTRTTLAEATGLHLTTIDDRLQFLVNEGEVGRATRGFYVPTGYTPARAVSVSLNPDGIAVVTIGETKLALTPREVRMLVESLSGVAGVHGRFAKGVHCAAGGIFGGICRTQKPHRLA